MFANWLNTKRGDTIVNTMSFISILCRKQYYFITTITLSTYFVLLMNIKMKNTVIDTTCIWYTATNKSPWCAETSLGPHQHFLALCPQWSRFHHLVRQHWVEDFHDHPYFLKHKSTVTMLHTKQNKLWKLIKLFKSQWASYGWYVICCETSGTFRKAAMLTTIIIMFQIYSTQVTALISNLHCQCWHQTHL